MTPKQVHDYAITDATNADSLRQKVKKRKYQDKALREIRLGLEDLERPTHFLLSEVRKNNPALPTLYTDNGSRLQLPTLTVATGEYLPGLIAGDAQELQMFSLWAPDFDDDEVESLIDVEELYVFNNQIGDTFIAWRACGIDVCAGALSLAGPMQDAAVDGKLIVTVIGRDTMAIRTISVDHDLICWLQAAGQCSPPDLSDDDEDEIDLDDDIVWDDRFGLGEMEGPDGDPAYRMDVRYLSDYALLVPTREVEVYGLPDALAASCRLDSVLFDVGFGRLHCPALVELRGKDLGTIVPEGCHDFPVLLIALPAFMGDNREKRALSHSFLSPCAAVQDSGSLLQLELHGEFHELDIACGHIEKTMALMSDYRELILVFVGEQSMWVRYYSIDNEWLSLLGATAYCACNHKPRDLWSLAEIEKGEPIPVDDDLREPKLIRWRPTVIEVTPSRPE